MTTTRPTPPRPPGPVPVVRQIPVNLPFQWLLLGLRDMVRSGWLSVLQRLIDWLVIVYYRVKCQAERLEKLGLLLANRDQG